MKKIFSMLAMLTLMLGMISVVFATPAMADETCTPQEAYVETIVDNVAWTEKIEHPAVTHTVHHAAETKEVAHDAIPGHWWDFAPNDQKKPFNGPPSFPTDSRGTWIGPHTNGGPSQDLTGTFQQGNGHGSWFHREAGTAAWTETVIVKAAWNEIVVDKAAWTETIEHPATTHEVKHDAVVCDTPTTPVEPTTPDEPVVPDNPKTPDAPDENVDVDTPVSVAPPASQVPVPLTVEAGSAGLPNTGGPSTLGLLFGAAMLLSGAALVTRRLRRR